MQRAPRSSVRSLALVAALSLVAVLASACGADRGSSGTPSPEGDSTHAPTPGAHTRESAEVGGDVIATVDGEPIRVSDVEAAARADGVSPAVALRRLEEDLAVAHLAEASAVADDPEVRAAARRAAVRELLHREIEASRTPEGVPDSVVEARREQIAGALAQPETRRATHLLVPLEPSADQARVDAAFRLARSLRDEVSTEADPSAALDAHVGREGAFDLTVEHLDAMRRDALDASFANALFSAEAPGLLPEVVRSSYGVHVVVLDEIVPPWEVPRDEWLPALRRQISAEERAAATSELADRLAELQPPLVNQRALSIAEQMPLGTSARSLDSTGDPSRGGGP